MGDYSRQKKQEYVCICRGLLGEPACLPCEAIALDSLNSQEYCACRAVCMGSVEPGNGGEKWPCYTPRIGPDQLPIYGLSKGCRTAVCLHWDSVL